MISLAARSLQSDELFRALLERRSRPYVVVLDPDLQIAFAESHALALLETHLGSGVLQDAIGELIRKSGEGAASCEQFVSPVEGLLLRIVPLCGPLGSYYAVFFEKDARREDLREAVKRFSLTPREVEVLDQILAGKSAAEIAEHLHIAEVTVFDHFKHISQKTNARNRADMLAKIFNWQSALTNKQRDAVIPMNPRTRRYSDW